MRPTWLSTSRRSVSTGSRPSPSASVRAGSRGSPRAHPTRCTIGLAFPSESPPDLLHLLSAAPRAATKVVGGVRAGRSVRCRRGASVGGTCGWGTKKSRPEGRLWIKTGGDLLSQEVALQVPSALRGLTALFGMGRGVSLSLSRHRKGSGRPPWSLKTALGRIEGTKTRQALDPLVPVC